jgi:hypothetical protein
MTTLILITPYMAFGLGVTLIARALHLYSIIQPHAPVSDWKRRVLLVVAALALPTLAQAQTVDFKQAIGSGNAIIMYLSSIFASVGIVTAGVAMMMGRQSIAKWAFAGAMVCGLAFAIVRTMWSNMGLEAAEVGTFTP